MKYPIFKDFRSNPKAAINAFLGFNRQNTAKENEFFDMHGVDFEQFPYLSSTTKDGEIKFTPIFTAGISVGCLCVKNDKGEAIYTGNGTVEKIDGIESIDYMVQPKWTGNDLDSFTGVATVKGTFKVDGTQRLGNATFFFYESTIIENSTSIPVTSKTRSERSIIDFNGNIILFPEKIFYSYVDAELYRQNNTNPVEYLKLRPLEGILGEPRLSNITLTTMGSSDKNNIINYIAANNVSTWEKFKNGDALTITVYKGNDPVPEDPYSTVTIDSKYKQTDNDRIVSAIVSGAPGAPGKAAAADKKNLYLTLFNRIGEKLPFNTVGIADKKKDKDGNIENLIIKNDNFKITYMLNQTHPETGSKTTVYTIEPNNVSLEIKRAIPDIQFACIMNNRIFGTDKTGECVYASKLGDFKNWHVYEGLSTDGWYSFIGTEGKFTGIASYRQTVILFKKNYMHQIYGDKPSNFSIPKQIETGCVDNATIAEIGGHLFFLGYDGVYVFTGGQPQKISQPLNCDKFEHGIAAATNDRYYLVTNINDNNTLINNLKCEEADELDEKGKKKDKNIRQALLAYDMDKNYWIKLKNTSDVKNIMSFNNGIYYSNEKEIFHHKASENYYGGPADDNQKDYWYVESPTISDGLIEKKGLNNLYFDFLFYDGSSLEVYLSVDGNRFKKIGSFSFNNIDNKNQKIRNYVRRLPVKFRADQFYKYKIRGYGKVVIKGIQKQLKVSGSNKNYVKGNIE